MAEPGLCIAYETDSFPTGTLTNGTNELPVTWDDVLWAAVTVGRPNRQYVFGSGDASVYEAVFRCSLVRMALEQGGLTAYRLRSTGAAKTLDPSEKGAVNYFLGMTLCKLFASNLLNTPWLLHLDVFRPLLNPVLKGRSRPDLVGKRNDSEEWHAFECKGRISQPDSTVKRKAKDQALRLVSVNGTPCSLHVGAITHFKNDILRFYWRDPAPEERNRVEVPFTRDAWRHYYAPVLQMITDADRRSLAPAEAGRFIAVAELDLHLGVHQAVAMHLLHGEWGSAQAAAVEAAGDLARGGYQPDGLAVKAGPSWRERFQDAGAS